MSRHVAKESGHAALLFALLCPFLLGIFILGSDAARAILDKVRLDEATEVAVLALSASNITEETEQRVLVKKYIEAYFDEVDITRIAIDRVVCDVGDVCQSEGERQRFIEYQLSVSIERDRLFFTRSDSSLGQKRYALMGRGKARRSEMDAMDVILVADYSSSMYDSWYGEQKYHKLNSIISDVVGIIDFNNQHISGDHHRFSVVPFDFYTSETIAGHKRFDNHLVVKVECGGLITSLLCLLGLDLNLDVDLSLNVGQFLTSDIGLSIGKKVYIDYQQTVAQVFDEPDYPFEKRHIQNDSFFYTVKLTEETNTVDRALAEYDIYHSSGSGTAFYAGLIRAAQIANQGQNPIKIIIILSDGEESNPGITKRLIDAGLCRTIKDTLNAKQVVKNGEPRSVNLTLAAIGFDYDSENNKELAECVGSENVYQAENEAAIKDKILHIIAEEVGHLAL